MRLVLDTNVLIAGLLRESTTRGLLLDTRLHFVVPEYALEELERHLPALAARMGIPLPQARLALSLLLERVEVAPHGTYAAAMPQAEAALQDGDLDDAPFLALALATGCRLWTNDKALVELTPGRSLTTKALLQALQA